MEVPWLPGQAHGKDDCRRHVVGLGGGFRPGERERPQDLVDMGQAARQQAPAGGGHPRRLDRLEEHERLVIEVHFHFESLP